MFNDDLANDRLTFSSVTRTSGSTRSPLQRFASFELSKNSFKPIRLIKITDVSRSVVLQRCP